MGLETSEGLAFLVVIDVAVQPRFALAAVTARRARRKQINTAIRNARTSTTTAVAVCVTSIAEG